MRACCAVRAAACSTTRARRSRQGPDPAVYGPPRGGAARAARRRRSRGCDRRAPRSRARSTRGAIGVVDLGGSGRRRADRARHRLRPDALEDVRWTRWGADGAVGRGRAAAATCEPTCAGGGPSARRPGRALRREDLRRAALLRPRRGARRPEGHALRRAARDLRASALLRRRGGADARGDRTAGTANGRSAPRTSGRPTRRRTAAARGRARPGRPARRPPRRPCPCPSTPGRRASARRARAGGCRARR